MKWLLGGLAAYAVLFYLNQHSYNTMAAACSSQTFPNVASGALSVPQIGAGTPVSPGSWCPQYQQWESEWAWFNRFVPKIEL